MGVIIVVPDEEASASGAIEDERGYSGGDIELTDIVGAAEMISEGAEEQH